MKLASSSSLDVGNAIAQSVFNAARALYPPSTVVHLGAGSGQGVLHQWRQWDEVPSSLLVDTQANRLSWAQGWVNSGKGRLVSDATVSAADGQTASLCHTSNPDETGLVGLPSLNYLWPQLRQIDLTDCQTRSLDSLISELVGEALSEDKNLWLLVDFFCAADFWLGASKALARARVVVLRQTVNDIVGIEPAEATAHRMFGSGFVCCASLESNHPGVVHVVYQRGLAKDLEAAQTTNTALIQERHAQQRAKDEALAQRDQEAQAKAQALSKGETLAQEKAELLASLQASQRAKDEALAQRDQEAQAKAQALSKGETLAQELAALEARITNISAEKDAETKRKTELLAQRDILVQEKAALAAAREFEMQAKSDAQGERDAKAKVISEQGDEMEKLRAEVAVLRADLEGAQLRAQTTENQNQNLYWRQDLLQDEMTKAEAQIDLIKDLLLRDPRL